MSSAFAASASTRSAGPVRALDSSGIRIDSGEGAVVELVGPTVSIHTEPSM